MGDDVDLVQLKCPDCDEVITGKAKGVGSAAFKLGGHRSNKHNFRNPNGPRRKTAKEKISENAPGEERSPTLLRMVEAATAEISDRSTKPPTVEELSRAGARFFGAVSVGLASYAAESDPTLVTEAERDALVDHLSLEASEARDLAYPLARAMGRTEINKKYGRSLVDNVDVVSAVTELAMIGVRWRRYFRMRDARIAGAGGAALGYEFPGPVMPTPVMHPMVVPDGVIMGPLIDVVPNASGPAERPGGAGPMHGFVMTPDIVEQMIRDGNRG